MIQSLQVPPLFDKRYTLIIKDEFDLLRNAIKGYCAYLNTNYVKGIDKQSCIQLFEESVKFFDKLGCVVDKEYPEITQEPVIYLQILVDNFLIKNEICDTIYFHFHEDKCFSTSICKCSNCRSQGIFVNAEDVLNKNLNKNLQFMAIPIIQKLIPMNQKTSKIDLSFNPFGGLIQEIEYNLNEHVSSVYPDLCIFDDKLKFEAMIRFFIHMFDAQKRRKQWGEAVGTAFMWDYQELMKVLLPEFKNDVKQVCDGNNTDSQFLMLQTIMPLGHYGYIQNDFVYIFSIYNDQVVYYKIKQYKFGNKFYPKIIIQNYPFIAQQQQTIYIELYEQSDQQKKDNNIYQYKTQQQLLRKKIIKTFVKNGPDIQLKDYMGEYEYECAVKYFNIEYLRERAKLQISQNVIDGGAVTELPSAVAKLPSAVTELPNTATGGSGQREDDLILRYMYVLFYNYPKFKLQANESSYHYLTDIRNHKFHVGDEYIINMKGFLYWFRGNRDIKTNDPKGLKAKVIQYIFGENYTTTNFIECQIVPDLNEWDKAVGMDKIQKFFLTEYSHYEHIYFILKQIKQLCFHIPTMPMTERKSESSQLPQMLDKIKNDICYGPFILYYNGALNEKQVEDLSGVKVINETQIQQFQDKFGILHKYSHFVAFKQNKNSMTFYDSTGGYWNIMLKQHHITKDVVSVSLNVQADNRSCGLYSSFYISQLKEFGEVKNPLPTFQEVHEWNSKLKKIL